MNQKYKVVVSEKVTVPVEGKLAREDGGHDAFKFTIFGIRLGAKALADDLKNEKVSAPDLLKKVITGWKSQRLVLEQDDTPAEFCEESFDALLEIEGMANYCLNAYLMEVQAKTKN